MIAHVGGENIHGDNVVEGSSGGLDGLFYFLDNVPRLRTRIPDTDYIALRIRGLSDRR